jgi:hypothetical protein
MDEARNLMAKAKVGPANAPVKQRGNKGNVTPSSLAALVPTQFPKGVSGNPAGRPKRKTVSEYFADILASGRVEGVEIADGSCGAEHLALAIFREACGGKFPFAKEILDRTEGKVPDRHAGHDGGPLVDVTKLSDHDLDALAAIYRKMIPGPPIDVTGGPDT